MNSLGALSSSNANRRADTTDRVRPSPGELGGSGGTGARFGRSTAPSFQGVAGVNPARANLGVTATHTALDIDREPVFECRQILADGGERSGVPDTDGAVNSRHLLPGDVRMIVHQPPEISGQDTDENFDIRKLQAEDDKIIVDQPQISGQGHAQALSVQRTNEAVSVQRTNEAIAAFGEGRAKGLGVSNEHSPSSTEAPPHVGHTTLSQEQLRVLLELPVYGGNKPGAAQDKEDAAKLAALSELHGHERRQLRDSIPQFCIFCGESSAGRGQSYIKRHWESCAGFELFATAEMLGQWIANNLRAFRYRELCQIYGGGPDSPKLKRDGTFCVRNKKFDEKNPDKRQGMLQPFTPPPWNVVRL